ncbi:MAG: hypothetical protein ISP53_04965 [Flavobacteriaceae bacterium]|nr:hypothetical protein [Flavobacteriaceae bacterium]
MRIFKTFFNALVSVGFFLLSFQVQAQTSFEFMPTGQVNLMIDEEQSFYLNIGGPTLYLFDSPNSKSGILFAPSLIFKNEESLKVAPANGAGVFWQNKNSGLKLTFLGFYDSANQPWNLAFGIGKIFKASKKK